jgi:hypothetical protein
MLVYARSFTPTALAASTTAACCEVTPPDLVRRDEQHPVRARECRPQRLGLRVVGAANLDPAGGEVLRLLGISREGRELARGELLQEPFDDEAAEVARGSGDDDHGLLRGV